jgi:dienelactone hydrolase
MNIARFVFVTGFILASAACSSQNDGPDITSADGSPVKSGIFSLFDPNAGTVPFPIDAFYIASNNTFTGTLNIPNPKAAPFVDSANLQDGFSTTASAFTDFLGFVDFATAATGGLIVVDGSTGTLLAPETDYTLQSSTARDDATGIPISLTRTRILIEPLKPLKPATTYIVAVTTTLKSKDGVALVPSNAFRVVRSAIPVTGSAGAQDSDPSNPNYTYLRTQSTAAKAQLEVLRAKLIRPTVVGLMAATGKPEDAFALAWTFTTQAIGDTLTVINTNATAKTLAVKNSGLTTTAVGAPPGADIYIGTLQALPYYLINNANRTATDTPLTSYWKNNGTPVAGNFGPTKANPDPAQRIPCGAFSALAPSTPGITKGLVKSTTACFPTPVKQSDETIPVLAAVPNAAGCPSGQPATGWPVAIFQHGITGNRSQMLALAPALAKACIVTLGIDLPLHGLPPPDPAKPATTDLLYNATGGIERTFNLDASGNGPGAPGYSGAAPSGTHFINLSSVITSRDNLRQAAADLITLAKSVPGTIFLTTAGAPTGFAVDANRIYFVGHSLGGIVGGTLLGVNSDVKAATLAMPGGGIAKLLDASISFSPRISAGLAASGVNKGTDLYETFMRFAQTAADSGDPINYAVAARSKHAIHMIEVIGDTVVPNNALTGTLASIQGFLSGTDPLYKTMGLTKAGPLDFSAGAPAALPTAGPGTVVQFAQGNHGSILDPSGSATNAAVTCEMQRQTVSFLASNGAALPLGGTCP